MAKANSLERNSLISEYQSYVVSVAKRLMRSMRLPVRNLDEYIAAGYLGLVEAAARFDSSTGIPFKKYAYLRIYGSIIDSIRDSSEISGDAYRYARALKATHEIEETAIKKENRSLEEVLDFAAKSALVYRISFADEDDNTMHDPKGSVGQQLEELEESSILKRIIEDLPEKERAVIEGYYFHNKSFVSLSEVLKGGASKSWVSRLHARAISMIKERYIKYLNGDRLHE